MMTWVDWAIIGILLLSTVGGLAQGFLRAACSLIGLVMGISIAAWNYHVVSNSMQVVIHNEAIANIVAFLLIAVLVMAVCNVLGRMLWPRHWIGWGWVVWTRLLGGVRGSCRASC